MRHAPLVLSAALLTAGASLKAQWERGDFILGAGGSWKAEEYRVKETLDSELDMIIGYYPIPRMGVGLLGNWGLTKFSYAEEDPADGVTYTNYKEGHWGGIGPFIRGHLGIPKFSVFGQLSAVFGSVEQDSENNLTDGVLAYYRQEGNYQQYAFAAGVWYFFSRRIGAEFVGSADWTFANIRSGTVENDGEISNYNEKNYDDTGGGWSLKLLYWFRLDKGAKKPADPGS